MKRIIALLKKMSRVNQEYPTALKEKTRAEFLETMRKFDKRRS